MPVPAAAVGVVAGRLLLLPEHELQLDPGQPAPVGEDADEGGDAAHEEVPKLDGQHGGGALVEAQPTLALEASRRLRLPLLLMLMLLLEPAEDGHDLREPGVHERLLRLLALADEVPAEGVQVDGLPAVAVEVRQGDGVEVVLAQAERLAEGRVEQVQVAQDAPAVAHKVVVPRGALVLAEGLNIFNSRI